MSTLLYHTGALGDFITAVPAMRLWKNLHRNESMVLLGKPEFGRFAMDAGLIDGYIDATGRESLPLFSARCTSEIEKLLSPFTSALLFAAPDSPIIGNVKHCGIAARQQSPFPAARIHVTDYHCSILADPRTLSAGETTPRIAMPPHVHAASRALVPADAHVVALHPGSGSKIKNWPFDRFLAVAEYLRGNNIPVLWMKGPAEEPLELPSRDFIAREQNLSVIAALLGRCRLYIGNDSGITHLAAATGCPTIALFGPSDPVVWAPRGKRVSILYNNKPCAPCHRRPDSAPIRCDNSCLAGIGVHEVLEKIAEIGGIAV